MLLALLASLAIHTLAQTPAESPEPNKDAPARKSPAERGADLYATYCALCHGKTGEGYLADEANALGNQDFLKSATDDFIIEAIVRGRPGTPMSAWGKERAGVLATSDVLAILAFIRSWQKEEPAEVSRGTADGDVKAGSKIYKRWCAACHGQKGDGASALSLNNTVFQQTASNGFIAYAIMNGRRETSMTEFKSRLSTQEIEDVVTFIRTLESVPEQVSAGPDSGVEFTPERLKRALLNPGNPLAEFSPFDGRYVPADVVHKAYKEKKSFVIIDARPYNDYLKSHIAGAVSVPFYEVEKAVDYLPRDSWIIAYCVCPHAMSGKALDGLREAGFEKSAILDEGFNEWKQRGYPSIKD
jgi:cytochrome c oxidase cbb3-type subunit 3/ubiquinol-cytochrome c reductase cytochrome c subunit